MSREKKKESQAEVIRSFLLEFPASRKTWGEFEKELAVFIRRHPALVHSEIVFEDPSNSDPPQTVDPLPFGASKERP